MRSGCSSGSIFWVLLVSGRFSVSKTIIPEHGSTFLPLQYADTVISSVDWGLVGTFSLDVDTTVVRIAAALDRSQQ